MEQKPLLKPALYREEIKDRIIKEILSGNLRPGDRIVETRWAKELGVSQSPVREAIRELEVTGFVENIPYKGSYVRTLTKKDIADSYKVRKSLELLGIEEASHNINQTGLEKLHKLLDAMRIAAQNGDYDAFIASDVKYHEVIMSFSNNELLKKLWSQANFRANTEMGARLSKRTLMELADSHQDIYVHLKHEDTQAALEEMKNHFELLTNEIEG